MKDNEWVYDILWAPPTIIEIDAGFIGWIYAQYAMKMAEINAMREERECAETKVRPTIPMWKKLIGIF